MQTQKIAFPEPLDNIPNKDHLSEIMKSNGGINHHHHHHHHNNNNNNNNNNNIQSHDKESISFDPETYALTESIEDLDLGYEINDPNVSQKNNCLNPITESEENNNGDLDNEEFMETLIDKDEMMETSDDQDILGSPHSSFSYDDTLSDQEIDGLTNYNIILEYPQLTFENDQLLPFVDELNDWFSFKDLRQLHSISKIAKDVSVADIPNIKEQLKFFLDNNQHNEHNGKILELLLHLVYIAMGCFNDARDISQIKETIFHNILQILEYNGLIDLIIDIVISNAMKLTESSNLESNIDMIQLKTISNQYFYALTVIYISLLSFNTQELNEYNSKRELSKILSEKNILIQLLKAIDRWKWISNNSENDDPSIIMESMGTNSIDNEKIQILVVTQFKIRNVLSIFNNLILFQFGELQHIQSTKAFLKYKFENKNNIDDIDNVDTTDQKNLTKVSDNPYSISSLDYGYYVHELLSRYPTYSPPKFEMSEIFEMLVNNENTEKISDLINVDSLLINQHQHLKHRKENFATISNDPPDIHIATPMPSPTLTPQHTGNTRNCSNISEFEHTSNEIKKKLYITQSNFPNIYPSSNNIPKSIQDATNIYFHHIKENYNTKQFTSVFEDFIKKENGYSLKSEKNAESISNYIFTEKDIKENPMFEDEIRSLQNVENFYKEGIPYFDSLIFISLKLLVSNIIPTQQSSENGKTRQRTPYTSKNTQDNNKPYISDQLSSFERQKLEINRMKETMLKNSSSIILLIQKWFKLSHILKFEFFTTLLFDQDFLIYLFRYLDSNKIQAHSNKDIDEDTKSLLNNKIVYCDYKVLYYLEDYNFFMKCLKISNNPNKILIKHDERAEFESIFEKKTECKENVNPLSFILPFLPQRQVFTVSNPNLRCCILISNLLQTMYYTISHFKIQRIYKLIGVRPTEILRFYLTLHNKLFYLPILKTIKLLSPFIGKKWRANNMDLISFVYLFHKVGLKDPWLNNFFNLGIEENTKRGFDNEVSLRSMIKFYNFQYYGEYLASQGFSDDCIEFMNEVERLGGDFFAKECLDIGV
jgi:hypothetical protein